MMNAKVLVLAANQGWSGQTVISLVGEFVRSKGLEDELFSWCESVAKEENEQSGAEGKEGSE